MNIGGDLWVILKKLEDERINYIILDYIIVITTFSESEFMGVDR